MKVGQFIDEFGLEYFTDAELAQMEQDVKDYIAAVESTPAEDIDLPF